MTLPYAHLLPTVLAVLLAAALPSAQAQGAAPAPPSDPLPDPSASKVRPLRATTPRPTPPASAPSPRLRPLAETGQQAEPPGDLRPERPVAVPQVSLPLGRTPPQPTPAETRAVDDRRATTRSGIDDSAARCKAQSDPQARARCASR